MKITKLVDLQKRIPSLVELSTRYLFGDKYPTEFSSSKHYNEGDYVYINNGGKLNVYLCTISGTYEDIHSNGWVSADVKSIVKHIYHQNHSVDEVKDVHDDLFDYRYIADCTVEGRLIMFEVSDDVLYHDEFELFIDGIRISKDSYEILQKQPGIIKVVDDSISLEGDILLVERIGLIPDSKLIHTDEYHPIYLAYQENELVDPDSDITITVTNNTSYGMMIVRPDDNVILNSCSMKIFINGYLLPDNYYSFTYDNAYNGYVIKFIDYVPAYTGINEESMSLNVVSVLFTYSLSPNLMIMETDTEYMVNTEFSTHILDVFTNSDIRINKCTFDAYVNGTRKNDTYIINNGGHNIVFNFPPGQEIMIGDAINLHVTKIIMNPDITDNIGYVQVVDPNKVQIPFYQYNAYQKAFLIFKENGSYVNYYKYSTMGINEIVPNNDWISPDVFVPSETLIFHQICPDLFSTIQHVVHVVDRNEVETGFNLPFVLGSNDLVMVFKGNGVHVHSNEYSITENMYVPAEPLSEGLLLEFVIIRYENEVTSSITYKVPTKISDSKTAKLELSDYNGETDRIMIFRESGTYLYDGYYNINNKHIVLTSDEVYFDEVENLDVYITRTLNSWIFVEDINRTISTILGE